MNTEIVELEMKVASALRSGKSRLLEIGTAAGKNMSRGADSRQVDRVLQKLRKRGEISYSPKDGWRFGA